MNDRGCSFPSVDPITGRACILLDGHAKYGEVGAGHRVDPPLIGSTAWADPWWVDFARVNPDERWASAHARWVTENPEEWAAALAYEALPSCRECGCTDDDACVGPDGSCSWAEPDLCSACA